MFEKKKEVTAAVGRLHSLRDALGKGKGDVLPWSEIERSLGMSRDGHEARHIIRRFQRELQRDRGIVTRGSTSKGGLWLLSDKDAAEVVPCDRQRKARRQCNRAINELGTIDGAKLSTHMRRNLSVQLHNLRAQRLQIGRSYRDHEKQVTKTEVNPRRKVLAPAG